MMVKIFHGSFGFELGAAINDVGAAPNSLLLDAKPRRQVDQRAGRALLLEEAWLLFVEDHIEVVFKVDARNRLG